MIFSLIRNSCLLIICYSTILFPQDNWINYTKENSGLPVNSIHTVAIDNQGVKWVGTWGGGLVKFDDTTWTIYNASNSKLPHNNIYSILIDSDNNKWIGTFGGGLAKFNDSTWTIYDTSSSHLPDNTIYSLAFDKAENLYIGTWGKGFAKFDKKDKWTNFNYSGSPVYNHKVPAIFPDSANNKLWIGTSSGLIILSDSTWTLPGDSIPQFNQSIYSFATRGDELWVAFKQGGLAEYKNSSWYFYDITNSSLPSNTIYHIAADEENNLWISTFGTGLVKYDGKEWIIYSKSNSPLTDDFIFSATPDSAGNVWVCTLNKGLFVIPPTK